MMRPKPQTILQRNVMALLTEQKMTFADLQRKLGWGANDISKLAEGRLDAQLDQIDALAHVLGALPLDLMQDFAPAARRAEYVS